MGMDWSAATFRDGYATEVHTGLTKEEAFALVLDEGPGWYAVEGTQMWNEPQGQVEEHSRDAKVLSHDAIKRSWKPGEAQGQPPDIEDAVYEVTAMGDAWVTALRTDGQTQGKNWEAANRLSDLARLANRARLVRYKTVKPARKVDPSLMKRRLQEIRKAIPGHGGTTQEGAFVEAVDRCLHDLGSLRLAGRVVARWMTRVQVQDDP